MSISKKVIISYLKAILLTLLVIQNITSSNFEYKDSESIKIFKLSANNENSILKVLKGEKFKIKIDGNPTTGYQWKLIKSNLLSNSNKIKSLDDSLTGKYFSSQDNKTNEEPLAGVGGSFYFTFEALSDGLADIKFEYKRSWEDENIDELTAHISIGDEVSGKPAFTTKQINAGNSAYYKICVINFILFCILTWFF